MDSDDVILEKGSYLDIWTQSYAQKELAYVYDRDAALLLEAKDAKDYKQTHQKPSKLSQVPEVVALPVISVCDAWSWQL